LNKGPRSNGLREGERLPQDGIWRTRDGKAGTEGDSFWYPPEGSDAYRLTKGVPVQYTKGQPDFTPWSKVTVKAAVTGGRDSRDVRNATRQLAQELIDGKHPGLLQEFKQAGLRADVYSQEVLGKTVPNVEGLKNWITQHGYTWHHTPDLLGYQLVPTILNDAAKHLGGSGYARKVIEALGLTAKEIEQVKLEGLTPAMIRKAKALGLIP
jgi:hypothetical protein